jgi:hypothetical protein
MLANTAIATKQAMTHRKMRPVFFIKKPPSYICPSAYLVDKISSLADK